MLSIPANTYSTYADASAALETAYDTLTTEEKRRSFIMIGHDIYKICNDNNKVKLFNHPWYDSSSNLIIYFLALKNRRFGKFTVSTSGLTVDALDQNAQEYLMSLYVYY